jgi:hypothetical protein
MTTTAEQKPARCETCVEIDALMKERNTEFTRNIFQFERHLIDTVQIETGRGKAKAATFAASFCPLCGKKWDDETKSYIAA